MFNKKEGIPRTLDPNPYFFDIFWQSVTDANRARATLRKIYWRQQNDSQPVVPVDQTESTELIINDYDSVNGADHNNSINEYVFGRPHVKIIEMPPTDFNTGQVTAGLRDSSL